MTCTEGRSRNRNDADLRRQSLPWTRLTVTFTRGQVGTHRQGGSASSS